MKRKETESKEKNLEDKIRQLEFELAVLQRGFYNMQIKVGELEMLIRGEKAFGNEELQ